MHDRFVRLILEIALPTAIEVWGWPALKFFQLLCRGTNFDTSFDSIGCQRTSTFQVPFVKDCFLNFGNTTHKVIKTLGVYKCQWWFSNQRIRRHTGLGTIYWKRQIVILEISKNANQFIFGSKRFSRMVYLQSHTWQIHNWFDTSLLQLLWIANATSLQNKWAG